MTTEDAYKIWKSMTTMQQMQVLKCVPKHKNILETQVACVLHIQKNPSQFAKAS